MKSFRSLSLFVTLTLLSVSSVYATAKYEYKTINTGYPDYDSGTMTIDVAYSETNNSIQPLYNVYITDSTGSVVMYIDLDNGYSSYFVTDSSVTTIGVDVDNTGTGASIFLWNLPSGSYTVSYDYWGIGDPGSLLVLTY